MLQNDYRKRILCASSQVHWNTEGDELLLYTWDKCGEECEPDIWEVVRIVYGLCRV